MIGGVAKSSELCFLFEKREWGTLQDHTTKKDNLKDCGVAIFLLSFFFFHMYIIIQMEVMLS